MTSKCRPIEALRSNTWRHHPPPSKGTSHAHALPFASLQLLAPHLLRLPARSPSLFSLSSFFFPFFFFFLFHFPFFSSSLLSAFRERESWMWWFFPRAAILCPPAETWLARLFILAAAPQHPDLLLLLLLLLYPFNSFPKNQIFSSAHTISTPEKPKQNKTKQGNQTVLEVKHEMYMYVAAIFGGEESLNWVQMNR